MKQAKYVLSGKRAHAGRYTGRLRELCLCGGLNRFYGAFLPIFLWPIILLGLVLIPYLVYFRILPCMS